MGARSQIVLFSDKDVLGYVRFHDEGMPFPDDVEQSDGTVYMHLPSAELRNVLDVLRNEAPVSFYFASGRAFLGTQSEPIGEGE